METPSSQACLFCRIVAGEIPARQVYADDHAIAFLDNNPWHPGHTLVIPRRHTEDLLSDAAALAEIAPAVSRTAALLTERLGADGLNLLSNAGAVAGQEVFHLHLHLVPRYAERPGLRELTVRQPGIDLDEVYRRLTAG